MESENSAICFIDKLVDDIFVQIFLRIVQDSSTSWNEIGTYPWLFMAICKRWRRVCSDHPMLWSYIDISAGHEHCCCEPSTPFGAYPYRAKLVARTTLQLERSGAAPLFIQAGMDCRCPSQGEQFRALIEHAFRWETANLSGFYTPSADLILSNEPSPHSIPLPQLVKLDLSADTFGFEEGKGLLPFADYNAMLRLRAVVLRYSYHRSIIFGDDFFPWARLTSLSPEEYEGNVGSLLAALPRCENLIHLSLSDASGANEGLPGTIYKPYDLPTAILPYLTHINISDYDDAGIVTHILPNLRTPSIQTLSLHIRMYEPETFESVLDFVQHSSHGECLTELDLDLSLAKIAARYYETPSIVPILELCPNLQVLTCRKPSDPDQLLRSLIIQDGTESLCPRLRKLCWKRASFDPALMIWMIESRINVSSKALLESVTVLYPIKADSEPNSKLGRRWMNLKAQLKAEYESEKSGFTFILGPE